jgi:mono/diheme cytochrome c family protein
MHEKILVSLAAAVAVLLAPAARAGEPPKKTPELLEKGKASFAMNCSACHGAKGEGDGAASAALNPKPRNFATEPFKYGSSAAQVFATLGKGSPGTAMIGFTHLPEEDRWGLAYYVLELKSAGKGAKK